MARRDSAITAILPDVRVITGDWTIEDVTEAQEAFQQRLLALVQNRSIPIGLVDDIGRLVRLAYDIGVEQTRSKLER